MNIYAVNILIDKKKINKFKGNIINYIHTYMIGDAAELEKLMEERPVYAIGMVLSKLGWRFNEDSTSYFITRHHHEDDDNSCLLFDAVGFLQEIAPICHGSYSVKMKKGETLKFASEVNFEVKL